MITLYEHILPTFKRQSIDDIISKTIGESALALTKLMSRPKLNWNWKIEPEQRLCIEFADILRVETVSNRLNGIWTHVANEGKRHKIVALILKAMGLISGAYDYWFIKKDGGLIIEFKVKPNGPTENQTYFGLWADSQQVPRYYCYSIEEALALLRKHGVL